MGARGPKPRGKQILQFSPGVPPPGDHLTPNAQIEYRRAVKICKESGAELQQVDLALLEVYAQSYADYWRLDNALRTSGAELVTARNGYPQASPLRALRDAAWRRLRDAAEKLGFSPADRARLALSAKRPPLNNNRVAEFLARGKPAFARIDTNAGRST